MKIVIDIPLGDYEWIKNHVMTVNEQMIANGKLLSEVLDDIKAEIQQVVEEEADDERWSRGLHYALKIINKHIEKEQSE